MKDKDQQQIFESYLKELVPAPAQPTGPAAAQNTNPGALAAASQAAPAAPGQMQTAGEDAMQLAIVALQTALKENPALAQQVLAMPEMAAAVKGSAAPAAKPAAIPAAQNPIGSDKYGDFSEESGY